VRQRHQQTSRGADAQDGRMAALLAQPQSSPPPAPPAAAAATRCRLQGGSASKDGTARAA
jgi:hypothetical protein